MSEGWAKVHTRAESSDTLAYIDLESNLKEIKKDFFTSWCSINQNVYHFDSTQNLNLTSFDKI